MKNVKKLLFASLLLGALFMPQIGLAGVQCGAANPCGVSCKVRSATAVSATCTITANGVSCFAYDASGAACQGKICGCGGGFCAILIPTCP